MWRGLLIGVALAVFPMTASAQVSAILTLTSCYNRDDTVSALARKYQESEVAIGVMNDRVDVEIFSTRAGTTWTIIFTKDGNTSCEFAAGENLETGNLGNTRDYFNEFDLLTGVNALTVVYPNLVARGNFKSGWTFAVIANASLEWKMFFFDPDGKSGVSVFGGKSWDAKKIPSGWEV